MGVCYQDLKVWHKAISLIEIVYQVSKSFPSTETFGLTNQIRRAAISIASNIAEGAARRSQREFSQFISIALGSLAEVETQLIIANRLGYCESKNLTTGIDVASEVGKMLHGLSRSLNNN